MQQTMTDSQGRLVPIDNIKPEHKLEDQLVNDLLEKARQRNNDLKAFKEHAANDINAFMDVLAERYNVRRGGRKGNLTLSSFDGLRRIQLQNADYIQFGPELQIAKSLIDECLIDWSAGINENLKLIIDRAFQVNKEGKVNTGEIMALRRLNIKDEKWERAMEAISNSMRVSFTRSYIRFYERVNIDAPWRAVTLDLAAV